MEVPRWKDGRGLNFYEARIAPDSVAQEIYGVLAITIDSLALSRRVSFVKIDAEGHELAVLEGMSDLIKRDHPTLVVEGTRAKVFLESFGYSPEHRSGSPNFIWRYEKRPSC
jgi:hypothetical protein